jgi:hypothetical protein
VTAVDAVGIKAPGFVDVSKPEPDDERFWSVTTILGTLDKPALLYWSAEQAALAACSVAKSLPQRIEEDGEEAVVKWLRDARFRKPKGQRSAADLGSAVHAACEEYALTGIRPETDEEVTPFLDQFDKWCETWQPEYFFAEASVFNPTYGYAGTCDAGLRIAGMSLITDYKSSRKSTGSDGKPTGPYPEVALQLAMYRYAELMATWGVRRYERFRRRYYLLSNFERDMAAPMPTFDGGICIHITPEHCDAYPVKCDEETFEMALYVLEGARWAIETSKNVIGAPLELGGL